jgi:putative flippase GtrA
MSEFPTNVSDDNVTIYVTNRQWTFACSYSEWSMLLLLFFLLLLF